MNGQASVSIPVKVITFTAMMTAINIAMSSFGVPVPGGHLYLNDIIICTAAMLLPALPAFVVGGIGAFLGDFFFYPAPMFVSLAVHGLQAVVISLVSHKKGEQPSFGRSLTAVALGAVIMVAGYSFGRAYIYSTPEYALLKLPFQILQAATGAVVSLVLVFQLKVGKLYEHLNR